MRLTTRQLQIMELLCQGLTNKSIAQQLGISEHTVRDHVSLILERFGCKTRGALIALRGAIQAPSHHLHAVEQRAHIDRRQATGDRRQATRSA